MLYVPRYCPRRSYLVDESDSSMQMSGVLKPSRIGARGVPWDSPRLSSHRMPNAARIISDRDNKWRTIAENRFVEPARTGFIACCLPGCWRWLEVHASRLEPRSPPTPGVTCTSLIVDLPAFPLLVAAAQPTHLLHLLVHTDPGNYWTLLGRHARFPPASAFTLAFNSHG